MGTKNKCPCWEQGHFGVRKAELLRTHTRKVSIAKALSFGNSLTV